MISQEKPKLFWLYWSQVSFSFRAVQQLFEGASQKMPVTSNPLGAKIIVDEEEIIDLNKRVT